MESAGSVIFKLNEEDIKPIEISPGVYRVNIQSTLKQGTLIGMASFMDISNNLPYHFKQIKKRNDFITQLSQAFIFGSMNIFK